MGKKKHKKKSHDQYSEIFEGINKKSKKKLDKEFRKALEEIEDMRIEMYESDKKKKKRSERKKINKEEAVFYTNMDSIKCRKKIAKKWEKDGFMDHMVDLLREVSPFVQLLAKALASLITLFLAIPFIKQHITPGILSKITMVFDIVMAV